MGDENPYPNGTQLRFIGVAHPDTSLAVQHLGHVGPEPGPGCVRVPLPIGVVGEVVAFVPAHVDGAGTKDGDCWVLTFEPHGLEETGGSHMAVAPEVTRHISFEAHQLAEWFEPVAGATQEAN